MDQIGLEILLNELKCVKLSKDSRVFINEALVQLKNGNLSTSVVLRIQAVARRSKKLLEELRAAREKAKRSLWKRRNGVTEDGLVLLVNARRAKEETEKSDLGI